MWKHGVSLRDCTDALSRVVYSRYAGQEELLLRRVLHRYGEIVRSRGASPQQPLRAFGGSNDAWGGRWTTLLPERDSSLQEKNARQSVSREREERCVFFFFFRTLRIFGRRSGRRCCGRTRACGCASKGPTSNDSFVCVVFLLVYLCRFRSLRFGHVDKCPELPRDRRSVHRPPFACCFLKTQRGSQNGSFSCGGRPGHSVNWKPVELVLRVRSASFHRERARGASRSRANESRKTPSL